MQIVITALAGFVLTGAAQEPEEGTQTGQIGVWQLSIKTDALTDKVTHTAIALGKEGAITLSCEKGLKPDPAYVSFQPLTLRSRSVFYYRFDDDPVQSDLWFYTSNGAAPRGYAEPFMAALPDASRLRVRVVGLTGIFDDDIDVSGADKAVTHLREQCGQLG